MSRGKIQRPRGKQRMLDGDGREVNLEMNLEGLGGEVRIVGSEMITVSEILKLIVVAVKR